MLAVGDTLRKANVGVVYLAHGTFVGNETLGVLNELSRIFPTAGKSVKRVIKRIVNSIAEDVGDYTRKYARCFETSINRTDESFVPVRLFEWSSENHHIGRADGAIRLINALSNEAEPGKRVMLWGHSHAGNVFALMSNLLSGNRKAIVRFFSATEVYYECPILRFIDIPVWGQVKDFLENHPSPLADVPLDIVTFGTPIRYGWDSNGYNRLLHFINHRPIEGAPDYRAAFPTRVDDILSDSDGDYVQQLGIAGTNVSPSLFAWRARLADKRLGRLLCGKLVGSPAERFKLGAIVPDEGTTLLVDYGLAERTIGQHFAGHAIYTKLRWLLFHAEETVKRFYSR